MFRHGLEQLESDTLPLYLRFTSLLFAVGMMVGAWDARPTRALLLGKQRARFPFVNLPATIAGTISLLFLFPHALACSLSFMNEYPLAAGAGAVVMVGAEVVYFVVLIRLIVTRNPSGSAA